VVSRERLDPEPARAQKMLQSALSGIGFDPAGRSKLGVAEVRRVAALEDLMSRRAR